MEPEMGDSEFVRTDLCISHHELVDSQLTNLVDSIGEVKGEMQGVKTKQDEYNATIKNIYYLLLILAATGILTLIGVVLGRSIDFHLLF